MTIGYTAGFIPRNLAMPVRYARRRSSGSRTGSLQNLAAAVARRVKTSRGVSGTRTLSKRSTDSGPITTQYDLSRRYRRKPMPKYKRKRWVGFTKRVRHVMLQQQALSSYTYDFASLVSWAIDNQATFGWMLGGVNAPNNDEIFQAFRSAYGTGLTITTVDDYKLFIKSMSMDIQIRNTGTSAAILDVYTCLARSSENTAGERVDTQYLRLYSEQIGGSLGSPNPANPASTPFQNPLWCSKWKIINKKEILLGAGSVTTMQLRNAANKMFYGKTLESNNSYIPGYTRCYLFQIRGVPEADGLFGRLAAGSIAVGCQWTVVYALPPGEIRAKANDI